MASYIENYKAKRERFCYEYCVDFNATKAAIRAGYSPKTARSLACRLLTKPNIQKRIKEKQANLEELAMISALKIVLEHKKIAFASAAKFRENWEELKDLNALTLDQKSIIQEISTEETESGISIQIKLYNKQKSLDALARILGFKATKKNELQEGPARTLTVAEFTQGTD